MRHSSRWNRHLLFVLGASGIVALLSWTASTSSLLFWDVQFLDLPQMWGQTLLGKQAQPQAPRVVVVDLGKGWHQSDDWSSFRRFSFCNRALHTLQRVLRMKATAVGVDLLFGHHNQRTLNSCSPQAEQELLLWRHLLKHNSDRMVLPLELVTPKYLRVNNNVLKPFVDSNDEGLESDVPRSSVLSNFQKKPLLPMFSKATTAQGVTTLLSENGLIWRGWHTIHWNASDGSQRSQPTFSSALVRLAEARTKSKQHSSSKKRDFFWVWWHKDSISVISHRHLVKPPPAIQTLLKGAVVLLGAVEFPHREDVFVTPRGLLSGVMVHAYMVDSLLNQPTISRKSYALTFLFLLLCGVGAWCLGRWVQAKRWRRGSLIGGSLLVVLLATCALIVWGWLPPVLLGLGCLGWGGWLGYRQQRRIRSNHQENLS